MSDARTAIFERFNELPRAMRWLAVALVGIALFLFWQDVLLPVKLSWDRQSDALEAQVVAVRNGELLTEQLQGPALRDTVLGVGAIELPSGPDEGRKAIADAVNSVLTGDLAVSHSFQIGESTLPREAAKDLVKSNKRLKTITGELRFEAKPDLTIRIINALERHPQIESVTSVRLTKINEGRLKVRLNFDTWIVAAKATRR
jgi:hypothetical protein